jgi:hypothetical protein
MLVTQARWRITFDHSTTVLLDQFHEAVLKLWDGLSLSVMENILLKIINETPEKIQSGTVVIRCEFESHSG